MKRKSISKISLLKKAGIIPTFDIEEAVMAIGIPTDEWVGNCAGISHAIVESGMIDGKVERGHWKGDVAKGSIFYGKPLIPHSWIRMANGKIADPTRWCFECVEPYISVGDEQCYDAGGNELRKAMMKPCPAFDATKTKVEIKFPASCNNFVMDLLQNPPYITINQLFWLGNLPLDLLKTHAKEIFTAFDKYKHGGIVPIDNYNIIMK